MDMTTTLIHPDSLGDTLDAVNAAIFYNQPISDGERRAAALWIAGRQGLPRSYAGMFAPTAADYALGALTFTSDPVVSGAGTAHILSEEACYALNRLGVAEHEVQNALRRARAGILRRIDGNEPEPRWTGVFCCATCSVALWRHLLATGRPDDLARLENGLAELKRRRDDKGRWKRFPFYYTLLALSEIDLPAARAEIHYALPTINRALRRLARSLPAGEEEERERRRRIILGRVLEKC